MAPRWVKKRDGRIEPYDEARIARAVMRAGRRTASNEAVEHLAREIARSVTLFLGKRSDRAPETELIAQAVADALEETGHGQIARAVLDWRSWRQRRSAEVRVRDREDASSVEVLSRTTARPWSKRRIVGTLAREAGLEQEAAEEVARAVEERVFAAGLNQISSNLLRELIDAELFERGYSAQLGRLEVLGVPKPELERLAFLGEGRTPSALEDRVSRTALERFALDEIVEGKGAVAHRRGDLHLAGLGRPLRMASGAVCAVDVADRPQPADSPIEVVRRWIQVLRGGATTYELMLGLVGPERVLARFEDRAAVALAVEVLLDAVGAPCPDDLPPAPEVVLVFEGLPQDEAERRALEVIFQVMRDRGVRSAGVRALLHVHEPPTAPDPLLEILLDGARADAGFDLAVGGSGGLGSRGMIPKVATVQVAMINVAGIALAAGRGQRQRFSRLLGGAVEAALEAFHQRNRRVFASVARPAFPLFGQDPADPGSTVGVAVDPAGNGDAIGLVGLEAAMRYLTGEGLTENPRVAELAYEVTVEAAAHVERAGARLGLSRVTLEDVPPGDTGIRLAAIDVDRFADARELLGEAAGWDAGVKVVGDPAALLDDLSVRLWLARKAQSALVLPRPVLALLSQDNLLDAVERSRGTSRPFKRLAR